MAVLQTFQWRADKGKIPEMYAMFAEAKKHHERLGARVRAVQTIHGGEAALTATYVMEHDDMAAFADFQERSTSDEAWNAFAFDQVVGPNAPGTVIAAALSTDIDLEAAS